MEELLNRPAHQDPPDIPPANDGLPIDCHPSTKNEIYLASKQLKKVCLLFVCRLLNVPATG